jgi:CMP/dCMP kinase
MNMTKIKKPLIIALDGHSSCGKSSFAREIAQELGYLYVDSGAMYRAVTLFAMRKGWIGNEGVNLKALENELPHIDIDFRHNTLLNKYETFLNGENVEAEIRNMAVSEKVSEISKLKPVRQRLVMLQQKLGERGGIVMDGRDIGTVVYPNADIKIFMTASIEVRAERRFKELKEKGIPGTLEDIRENLAQRDYLDQTREESPLKKANDAIVLDNSHLTPREQMVWFLNFLTEKFRD